MASAKYSFDEAIVFCNTPAVIDMVRTVLKEMNVSVHIPQDVGDCVRTIQTKPNAALVVDFAAGAGDVHEVLVAAQAQVRAAVRPIFLFSMEAADGLDGVAAEFAIYQMHVGELSKKVLKERLQELGRSRANESAVAMALVSIADARKKGDWNLVGRLADENRRKYAADPRFAAEYAEALLQTEKVQDAIDFLTPLCDVDKKDVRLLNILGRGYLKLGKFDEATIALQQAKVLNPFNVERLVELGDAYLMIDMVQRAKENYEQALDLSPRNGEAKKGMGKSLLMSGEINHALPFLKELSGPEEAASVFNNAAVLCMRNGRHDDGFNLYKIAIKAVGSNDSVLAKLCFNLGIGYHRLHDNDHAKKCFAVAIKLDPAYERARQNLLQLERTSGPVGNLAIGPDRISSVLEMANVAVTRGKNAQQFDELAGEDYDLMFK